MNPFERNPQQKAITIKSNSFEGRAMSGFPLSIGTAIAFETLFTPTQKVYDADRELPPRVDISFYHECWINLETIVRNLIGSVDPEFFVTSPVSRIVEVLESEMDVIFQLFQLEGNDFCKPIFYLNEYKDLNSPRLKNLGVSIRERKTPKQQILDSLVEKVFKELKRRSDVIMKVDDLIVSNSPNVRSISKRILLISHIPYDLLAYKNFEQLDLLESHTGALKKKHQWNSKYYAVPGEDMSHLPFHRKLLLIFGDRVLISPMDLKFRKQILETSKNRHWTPLTTKDKIVLDLGFDIRDPYALTVIRNL